MMFMQCILESGRDGYPGQKGQRGDHGLPGPNVIDLISHLRSFVRRTELVLQTHGSRRPRPLPGPPGYPVRIDH